MQYQVVSGTVIDGKPTKAGEIVDLTDAEAAFVLSLVPTRIVEYVKPAPKAKKPVAEMPA